MANKFQIKKIEANFKEFLIKNKKIKSKSILFQKVNALNLNSLSENSYKNLLEINLFSKEDKKLNENTTLNLSGFTKINIIIEKSLTLNLNILNQLNFLYIKILIKPNQTLILNQKVNALETYEIVNLFIEKNAKVEVKKNIQQTNFSIMEAILKKDAKFESKITYSIKNQLSYIKNISKHLECSTSKIQVIGCGLENSEIINDGQIIIEKNATNTISKQNLKNIILSETSKISSMPTLEIKNPNVICSHSSSISKLDKKILYYLKTKGLTNLDVKNLIIKNLGII